MRERERELREGQGEWRMNTGVIERKEGRVFASKRSRSNVVSRAKRKEKSDFGALDDESTCFITRHKLVSRRKREREKSLHCIQSGGSVDSERQSRAKGRSKWEDRIG